MKNIFTNKKLILKQETGNCFLGFVVILFVVFYFCIFIDF